MTIKKQWLIYLILIAVFSVMINTAVLSALTQKYFNAFVQSNYDNNVQQITQYLNRALTDKNITAAQMKTELETLMTDPIKKIRVYDKSGNLLVEVSTNNQKGMGMQNGSGMMRRLTISLSEEIKKTDILSGNEIIGQLNIIRYSSSGNSIVTTLFKYSLFRNSLIAVGIVLLFAVMTGMIVSKKMSRDLIQTADMAHNIDIGKPVIPEFSKVKEIRVIQQSLETLNTRLKLKQKSRKTVVDELVHQTRTPLTILKMHLEGMQDGVIELTSEEIALCEEQIANITYMIANMSSVIDAENSDEAVHIENFEFNALIKQILGGLKMQFDKKNIELKLTDGGSIPMNSDKYKLSQVIYNVLTNAYKFTDAGGKVSVAYQKEGDKIILSVADTGVGISEAEQAKIFDAYYRVDSTSGISGDGIGLYIAKENLARIHGSIKVESAPDKGSKFIIEIPIDIT